MFAAPRFALAPPGREFRVADEFNSNRGSQELVTTGLVYAGINHFDRSFTSRGLS
jgi:hypothetical protein